VELYANEAIPTLYPEQFVGAFPLIQNSDCVEIYLRLLGTDIDTRIFSGRAWTRLLRSALRRQAAVLSAVLVASASHPASSSANPIQFSYGLGAGVGRGLAVGCGLTVGVGLGVLVGVGVTLGVIVGVGVTVAVAVGVGVTVGVEVGVGVGLAVGVGVGDGPCPPGNTRT
jgi:hypothetical protein